MNLMAVNDSQTVAHPRGQGGSDTVAYPKKRTLFASSRTTVGPPETVFEIDAHFGNFIGIVKNIAKPL